MLKLRRHEVHYIVHCIVHYIVHHIVHYTRRTALWPCACAWMGSWAEGFIPMPHAHALCHACAQGRRVVHVSLSVDAAVLGSAGRGKAAAVRV